MGLLWWIWNQRVILFVCVVGVALAYSELRLPDDPIGPLDRPDAYFAEETSVADVSAAIYPDRALTLYHQAFQESLCTSPRRKRLEGCDERDPVEPGEARELIERAVAKGNRSIEQLLYGYAVVLVQEGALQEEIDATVCNWRITHPTADRADPRTVEFARKQGTTS